jgi:hypothetical protein
MATAALLAAGTLRAAENVSAALANCLAMAGAEARLACYDALAKRSGGASASNDRSPAAPSAPAAGASTMPAHTAPVTAAPVAAAAAAATVVAAPAPVPVPSAAPDPAEAAKNFGLSSAQLHSAPQGPQSIEARVAQVGADRGLRSYVVLDNGQSWLSTDGGMELVTGEQVNIKRAALGSFMLVSSTSKHSYHVRRLH